MKVFLRSVLIVAFLTGLVQANDEEERPYGRNTLRNQPYVQMYQQDKMGLPTFIRGDLGASVLKGRELEATIEFFERHRMTFGMTDPAAELWLRKTEVDELSMTHVRLSQHYRDVRVMGGELVSHFSAAGELRTVNGTFRVADGMGAADEDSLGLLLNAAITITTDSLPDGKEGEAYSAQLAATGGTEPVSFSDRDGELAGTGLILTPDGLVSGDPFEGMVSFTALVTEFAGSDAERLFTFEIAQGWTCGDINNDGVGPDIVDLTFIVFYMFQDGDVPPYLEACNVDGNSEGPDIGDLTHVVF